MYNYRQTSIYFSRKEADPVPNRITYIMALRNRQKAHMYINEYYYINILYRIQYINIGKPIFISTAKWPTQCQIESAI